MRKHVAKALFVTIIFGIAILVQSVAAQDVVIDCATTLQDGQPAQCDQADALLSSNSEAATQQLENMDGGINFGVWYPYFGNNGVPPISSFTARGINVTFIQGDLDASEIAKYDVIFIGRAGMIGNHPPGAGTLDIDALITFVDDGGGLIGESNATIYDSDYHRGVDWSSRLSVLQGISGPLEGYDYGNYDFLPVSITNLTHPITQGVAPSFTLLGEHANKESVIDTGKNPTAVQVGTVQHNNPNFPGFGTIVAADYGHGCSVYFPTAVGYFGMDWGANPDYETLFINAVEYAGTCGVIEVEIDVQPGDDIGCINNDGNGVIPVAILTTADFDAATVDPTSVALDSAAARMKGKSGNVGALEDIDGDGDLDLVLQIVDTDGTYVAGDTVATLTGLTYDGTAIEGTDTICIVP